jgi:FMN phosphatase YigB (HAD superfamily)
MTGGPTLDAVVLDLDDTILDTAGLLVPVADRRAIQAMIDAGLPVDADTASATLSELRSQGVENLFGAIVARHGGTPECAAAATETFYCFDVPPIALEPDVDVALHDLYRAAPLALLTAGHEPTQRQKVRRLDLEPLFVECVYVPLHAPGGKEPALRELLHRRGWRPEHVVVAGDRPASDIRAGNAVGCRTVLVRAPGGEFASHAPRDAGEAPWATIGSLTELPGLLGL